MLFLVACTKTDESSLLRQGFKGNVWLTYLKCSSLGSVRSVRTVEQWLGCFFYPWAQESYGIKMEHFPFLPTVSSWLRKRLYKVSSSSIWTVTHFLIILDVKWQHYCWLPALILGYFSNILVEKPGWSPYFKATPYYTALNHQIKIATIY